jgi:predicted RNA-binding protein
MCELKAYLKIGEREELLLEAVTSVRTEGDVVVIKSLFGEEKKVRATLREVSLARNQVILEPR